MLSNGSQDERELGTGQSLLGDQIRMAMRKVPHPLMIITAAAGSDQDSEYKGLLVSSFNTVTLDPEPFVSFNVKIPSSTYDAISKSGYFEVSAVCHEPTARTFAGRSHGKQAGHGFHPMGNTDISSLADNRAFALHCKWLRDKSVELGDHIIMVGRVLDYVPPQPNSEDASVLLYSEGECRHLTAPRRVLRSR